MSERCKTAIVCKNWGEGGRGRMRSEETLSKCDPRMLRLGKSCQNAAVECGVCETCKNGIVRKNGVPGRRGREEKLLKCDCRMLQLSKSCQNATVECKEGAKAAKMQSYARTGCGGGVGEKKSS